MKKIKCAVIYTKEENWIVATDYISNVASQGKTVEEATDNLKEALELYYEDISDYEEVLNTSLMEVCV